MAEVEDWMADEEEVGSWWGVKSWARHVYCLEESDEIFLSEVTFSCWHLLSHQTLRKSTQSS